MALGITPKVMSSYPFSTHTQTLTPISHKSRGPVLPLICRCKSPAELSTSVYLHAGLLSIGLTFLYPWVGPVPSSPLTAIAFHYHPIQPTEAHMAALCSAFLYYRSHRVWLSLPCRGGNLPHCLCTPSLKGSTFCTPTYHSKHTLSIWLSSPSSCGLRT